MVAKRSLGTKILVTFSFPKWRSSARSVFESFCRWCDKSASVLILPSVVEGFMGEKREGNKHAVFDIKLDFRRGTPVTKGFIADRNRYKGGPMWRTLFSSSHGRGYTI